MWKNNNTCRDSRDTSSVYIISIQLYIVDRFHVVKNQRKTTKLKFMFDLYFVTDTTQCLAKFCFVIFVFNSLLRIRNFRPKINTSH